MRNSAINNSYKSFLELISYDKFNYPMDFVLNNLNILKRIPEITLGSVASYFVLDYSTKKYVLLSSASMLGYRSESYLEGGLEFVLDIYHKEDFAVFNENIFNKNIEFIKKVEPNEQEEYQYTFSFRARDRNKNYRTILQRTKYIVHPVTRLPQFAIGASSDITDFYKSTAMIWMVEKNSKTDTDIYPLKLIDQRFFPIPDEAKFTKREMEILHMIADGLVVKEIANKLNVAERTIINHKQNMYKKSNARTTGALLRYGFNNGII